VWLVSADLDAVLNVVGGLLRAFGTQDPPTGAVDAAASAP
jgi:hypothetical protein